MATEFGIIETYARAALSTKIRLVNGYIFIASGSAGLSAYTFDGTNITHVATIDDGGSYSGLFVDNENTCYVAGSNLTRIYTFDGTSFTQVHSDANQSFNIWYRDGYVYTVRYNNGVSVYSWDGATLTHIDSDVTSGQSDELYLDDTYIYVGSEDRGVLAYSFDGATLNYIARYEAPGDVDIQDLAGNGSEIYAITFGNNIHRITFDGTTFTVKSVTPITKGDYLDFHEGLLYARLTDGVDTFLYAYDTRQSDALVEYASINLGASTFTGGVSAGDYTYTGKGGDLIVLNAFQYGVVADFDWSPKNKKAPIVAEFEDKSTVGYY